MDEIDKMTDEVTRTVDKISPFLVNKGATVQGMILAELTAMWLFRHRPEIRDEALELQNRLTMELLPGIEELMKELLKATMSGRN